MFHRHYVLCRILFMQNHVSWCWANLVCWESRQPHVVRVGKPCLFVVRVGMEPKQTDTKNDTWADQTVRRQWRVSRQQPSTRASNISLLCSAGNWRVPSTRERSIQLSTELYKFTCCSGHHSCTCADTRSPAHSPAYVLRFFLALFGRPFRPFDKAMEYYRFRQ